MVAGGTPKASDASNFAEPKSGIAWLTPADLSNYTRKFIGNGARDLSQKGYESSSAKLIPEGSILFSSRAPIGYVAIASNEISTNQGFKNFVLPSQIDSSYAYYFLRSIRDIAESRGTGTTFKEISGANAKKLPFVLPPLAEQKVIADKLDTLLEQVESTKARLDRIPQILKRFRQSVLAAAVSGRLTEEWRRSSCGEHSVLTKSKLSEIADILDPNPSHRYPASDNDGVPILSTQQFTDDAGWTTTKAKLVSREFFLDRASKCGFYSSDIIFARKGRLGLARFAPHGFDYVFSHTLFIVRAKANIDARFLLHFLQQSSVVDHLLMVMNSNTGVPTLGKAVFEKLEVPVPELKEQTEIVRRVDQLFAYADTLEKQVAAAQKRVNNLTQSILAKAFRGELTEQWRKDNPDLITGDNSAEALLAKIKAERDATKPMKKTRKRRVQ